MREACIHQLRTKLARPCGVLPFANAASSRKGSPARKPVWSYQRDQRSSALTLSLSGLIQSKYITSCKHSLAASEKRSSQGERGRPQARLGQGTQTQKHPIEDYYLLYSKNKYFTLSRHISKPIKHREERLSLRKL